MAVDIAKLIEKIKNGNYSPQELENLRKNSKSRSVDEVVSACDEMLSQSRKLSTGGGRKTQDEMAELRSGFVIMRSAYDADNKLLRPEMIKVAEELSRNQHVNEISILKTQIKLYYKGRHFTSGQRPQKELFWLSCLDETKITDSTVERWKKLGEVYRAKYFSTYYVGVNVEELSELHSVLNCVEFT